MSEKIIDEVMGEGFDMYEFGSHDTVSGMVDEPTLTTALVMLYKSVGNWWFSGAVEVADDVLKVEAAMSEVDRILRERGING